MGRGRGTLDDSYLLTPRAGSASSQSGMSSEPPVKGNEQDRSAYGKGSGLPRKLPDIVVFYSLSEQASKD